MARVDAPISNEINDVKTFLFLLREYEKTNDLLRVTTVTHNLLAENLWQLKIWYKYGILDTNSNNDSNMIKQ